MTGKNEGEGSRTAARAYNQATQKHIHEHDVKKEAEEAKRAFEGAEGQSLRQAEEIGKSHAKSEDPQIKR